MKRILLVAGITLVLLLAVAIVLPFVVNVNTFKPMLESSISSVLGRRVTVGNLRLSILKRTVSAESLSIADDPAFGSGPFVKARALEVGIELMPLLVSRTLSITDLTLDRPEIVLLREDSGRWNYSSLGAGAGTAAGSGTATGPGARPGEKGKGSAAGQSNPSGVPGAGTSTEKGDGPHARPSLGLTVGRLSVKDGRASVGRVGAAAALREYQSVNVSVRGFSWNTPFTFTISAALPGGGDLKIEGTAGPIAATDASMTPLTAAVRAQRIDLARSGFFEPSSGIAGTAGLEGTISSDGRHVRLGGALSAEKLKLVPAGSPAGRPVLLSFSLEHDRKEETGVLTQGDIGLGKARGLLTGAYRIHKGSALLKLRLEGKGMPVDDLEAVLPAIGLALPKGSSLEGGTLALDMTITGSTAAPLLAGSVRITDTRLAGFDLGSKLSAISALTGARTGSDTTIQNISADVHASLAGIRADTLDLTVAALGALTGKGTISPEGALDFRMTAHLTGSTVTGLTKLAGLGGKGGSLPFFIKGTCSSPTFSADLEGMLGGKLGSTDSSKGLESSAMDALSGLLGKKKKPH